MNLLRQCERATSKPSLDQATLVINSPSTLYQLLRAIQSGSLIGWLNWFRGLGAGRVYYFSFAAHLYHFRRVCAIVYFFHVAGIWLPVKPFAAELHLPGEPDKRTSGQAAIDEGRNKYATGVKENELDREPDDGGAGNYRAQRRDH